MPKMPEMPKVHVVLTEDLAKMEKMHVFLTVHLAKVPEMHVFCILHAFWQVSKKKCKLQTF
jgi:hypothetical protein